MHKIAIIGTGYVSDLYMRSFELYPHVDIVYAYDLDQERLNRFCSYWKVKAAKTIEQILDSNVDLVLNLTNPGAHYEVSKQCLNADKNVYSEKPLSVKMDQAFDLHQIAKQKGLLLGSAPCSFLSETAQTIKYALAKFDTGKPYLIYAELDDDFIPQAPYKKWISESGSPWPYIDEFKVGCTLEHAGYYLTWLMFVFGSVNKVIAASADLVDDKLLGSSQKTAPDYSTAILFFESGVVARLTCSIIAPHDHQLRIFCSNGVLSVDECWNNSAKVKFRKRFPIRRRLVNSPFSRTIKLKSSTHEKIGRKGAASMNFALGPIEMLEAIENKRDCRVSADFALHLNEVTLAIQNSFDTEGVQIMKTKAPTIEAMPWSN